MSFPRYPEYRDSGVDWLGEVPTHWTRGAVKHLCKSITDGAHISPETDGGIYPFVSTKDVGINSIDFESCLRTSQGNYEYLVRTGCRPQLNDVLFSKDGTVGRTVVVRDSREFVVASSLIIIRPDATKLLPDYLHYLSQSVSIAQQVESFVKGAGLPRLSIQNLLKVVGIFPPLSEQLSIVGFLTHQTDKIDALIAEQEGLIALLREKRQAVISHTVTKGLNPAVPMKDSGIKWLGDIPEHWSISRIKYISEYVVDCLHTTPTYDGDVEFPAIRTADVDRGILLLDQARLVSRAVYEERIERLRPIAGDILYSREGERFGMAALVPEGVDLCLGQRMMMFRVTQQIDSAFIMWVLNSDSVYQQVTEGTGGSTAPHVNISDVINFHIPFPPFDEQQQIALSISRKTSEIETLTAEAQRAIELLKERRSALISAAVTGKIDVRGLVDTEAA